MKIQHLRNGVILISIGLVFLFNNLGYVDWEVWETILSWWPVYLIALGIEIVFRNSRLKPIALISPLVFAIFILGPAWWQWEGREKERLVQVSQWSQPISAGTNLFKADLQFRLGNLKIGDSDERAVNCQLEYQAREPYRDFTEMDGVAKLTLEDRSKKYFGFRFDAAGFRETNFSTGRDKEWKVAFDTATPLEMELCSQLAKNEFDFTKIKARRLDFTFQLSKGDIKLGEKADTVTVNLDLELSKVNLWVPEEAVIFLEKHLSLGGISTSNVNVVKDSMGESDWPGKPVIFVKYEGALSKLNIRGF